MNSKRISNLQLEQFLLNELPEDEMAVIENMRKKDEELQGRIDGLRKSNEEIITSYPPKKMLEEIKMKASLEGTVESNKREGRPLWKKYSAPLTAAASLFIVFGVLLSNYNIIPGIFDRDIVRIKGLREGLYVYRKTSDGVENIKKNTYARPGDLLQIGYVAGKDYSHGVVLSIDGRGNVTLQYPETAGLDTKVTQNRKVFLKKAYELDDAPEFERFILLLSEKPIEVNKVLARARQLAADKNSAKNEALKIDDAEEYYFMIKKDDLR